jgi:hypothetical protein
VGSVPILITSGDNDPELEPVQSFRHYLYCDACGSFDLAAWETVERSPIERRRARLGALALYVCPFVFVPALHAAGVVFPVAVLALLAMGIALQQALKALPFRSLRTSSELGAFWRFALGAAGWAVLLALAEGVSGLLPAAWVAMVGSLVVVGALVGRAALAARVKTLGLRCRQCAATYPFGSPFFSDLDANPRSFGEADLPRPLWRLEHLQGRFVGPAPAAPLDRVSM